MPKWFSLQYICAWYLWKHGRIASPDMWVGMCLSGPGVHAECIEIDSLWSIWHVRLPQPFGYSHQNGATIDVSIAARPPDCTPFTYEPLKEPIELLAEEPDVGGGQGAGLR